MSSAILYVAIVAIWACVLIPRWLRRDSARGAGRAADAPVPDDVVRGDVVPAAAPGAAADGDVSRTGEPASPVRVRYTETFRVAATVEVEADPVSGEVPAPAADAGSRVPPPRSPEESRRRMLAARRRLLYMLTILEIAAVALATLGFAALWVLIPPSVMLVGYLLLLREASHADAERAQREEEAARARARARARAARERIAQRAAAAPPAPTAAPAPAAPAARYEDANPGRDFAPGLAGKYTTSNAEAIGHPDESGEDNRDEYPLRRLRAVGD